MNDENSSEIAAKFTIKTKDLIDENKQDASAINEESAKCDKKPLREAKDQPLNIKNKENQANDITKNSKSIKFAGMRASESIEEIKQITSELKRQRTSSGEEKNSHLENYQGKENKKDVGAKTSKSANNSTIKPKFNSIKNALTVDQIGEIEKFLKRNNCKCRQISSGRFSVGINYQPNLVDIFRSINYRQYDVASKTWNFPNHCYDDLLYRIKEHSRNTFGTVKKSDSIGSIEITILKDNRFGVDAKKVSKNFKELEEIFRKIKTCVYDEQSKCWSFKLNDYEELIENIRAKFQSNLEINDLNFKIKSMISDKLTKNLITGTKTIDFEDIKSKIDPAIAEALLPFQVESVCFAIKREGKALLADDMGLGKTIQALAVASYYKSDWPIIIIAPSSVKHMWQVNAIKWLPNTLCELCGYTENLSKLIQVIDNGRDVIDPDCQIYIISYELLANRIDEISKRKFKIIIADESHLVKTARAKRTLAVKNLVENAHRVLMLSGTPALSRPSELFTQIQMICPGLFADFISYGKRYCNGVKNSFGWDFSGSSNTAELKLILEEMVLIRHEKKEIMDQLVKKTREKVILKKQLLDLSADSLGLAADRMHAAKGGIEQRGALITYFHETCKAKCQAVSDYVLTLLKESRKIIVFAHHKEMLDELEKTIEKTKYKYIRIDGSTNSKKRQTQVNMFQNKDDFVCALLSITAAGNGITLTKANLVVFAELFWNPGSLVQAEDRAYRIGQKKPVHIQYLLAEQTVDTIIWPLINNKLGVLNKIGLTNEDIDGSADDHSILINKIQEVIDNEPEPEVEPEKISIDNDSD